MGHHPMDDDIDGDEGDGAPQRACPSRYMKSVGMLGALTIYCFIVTDDEKYQPLWRRNWRNGVIEGIAKDFADQVREGPRILGFAVGHYEFQNLPVNAADNDKFSVLRKASYTASKQRLGQLRGWLIWRALCWIFTDGDLVDKPHGLPPNPFN